MKRQQRQLSGRRCARIEQLESKTLLAGDVLVSVVHGDLRIQGDALDNQVALTAGAEAGTVLITGLDGTNLRLVDRETGLPGDAVGELEVAVRGGAKIELGDGNDAVALAEVDFRGRVAINAGAGNDEVNIATDVATGLVGGSLADASVGLRGGLKVNLGSGDDELVVANASLQGRLEIDAGSGNDSVTLGAEANGGVGGLFNGELPDAVLNVQSGVDVDLGAGDDLLAMLQVRTHGHLSVQAGAGDDDVSVNLTAAKHVSLLGGGDDGLDTIEIVGSHANHLAIHTGAGADEVSLADSVFTSLGVFLGDGDDTLATADVSAKFALLLGGIGEDTLNELAANELLHDVIQGFELPLVEDLLDDLPLVDQILSGVVARATGNSSVGVHL